MIACAAIMKQQQKTISIFEVEKRIEQLAFSSIISRDVTHHRKHRLLSNEAWKI
jgi:hypothetical protein